MQETKYWLLNIVCAVVILVLLGAHMGIMHLDDLLAIVFGMKSEPLAWENMVVRGRSGFFTATYILLLGTALFHGLYGLRTMLIEYFSSARAERIITAACVIAGVTFFGVGTFATVAFQ